LELILEANSSEEVEFNKTFDTGEGGEREKEEGFKEREGIYELERKRSQRQREKEN